MIRRHVLAALATGVEAGNDDAARAVVGRGDWLIRGAARRQLERVLIDAALISRELVTVSDADAMRHVQRVAALSLAGRYDVDATDRVEVTTAYRTLRPPQPAALPIATIIAAIAVATCAAMLAWFVISMHRYHRHPRPDIALPWGAYLTGGVPERDPELERLLVAELPVLAIETDNDRRGNGEDPVRKRHVAELRGARAIVARGAGLANAWRDMIGAFDHWVHVPQGGQRFREAEAALRSTTQGVTDQFAALGLAYHLEADILIDHRTAHAGIFVFGVEEVVYVHAGGEPRRVLSLRRLDHLNLQHALLGMQTEELGDPVVLVDQVEEFVANRVAPVLGEGSVEEGGRVFAFGSPFPIGDSSWFHTRTGIDLAADASEAIRREIAPIVQRAGLDGLRRAVVATVRRHEARHGYDIDREEPLRYPNALVQYAGPDQGKRRLFVARARAELAAYLSQIASDPLTPQLSLWNLVNLGFNRDRWGTAEAFVSIVVIEGLARRLGVPSRGDVIRDGQLDRAKLAALATPLAAVSDDTLRATARGLWQDLYGEPFLAIVDP